MRHLPIPLVLLGLVACDAPREPTSEPSLEHQLVGDLTNDGTADTVRTFREGDRHSIVLVESHYRIASESRLAPELLAITDIDGDGLNDLLYRQQADGHSQYTLLPGTRGVPSGKRRLIEPPQGF